MLDDVRDATVIQLTPAVISRSVKLLENNMLRAMDGVNILASPTGEQTRITFEVFYGPL